MKAISLRRDDRFADIEELIYQLETEALNTIPPRNPVPLLRRNPVLFWKGVSAFLSVLVVIELLIKK